MSLFLITIAFALIGVYEALPLTREKAWRELITVGCIWFLGFALSILITLDAPLPSPIAIMEFVSDMVLGVLRLVQ
jgi:hypothetical protein